MVETMATTGAGARASAPADPGHTGQRARTGLRERKKQQTRTRIIEVALDLCDARGFEATTVEQIANAADVSPRTVNRYFDMKEDIVLAPIDDFGHAVADALRKEADTGDELRSLCHAYVRTIENAVAERSPLSFRRFQQMQRIAHDSPSVGARALDYADSKSTAVSQALGERLGTEPDALAVRLIVSTSQMLCHVAMEKTGELILTADPETASRVMRESLLTAYAEFRRVCAGSPPAESA